MVFRPGPALLLCPLALAYGIHFVERAVDLLEPTANIVEFRSLLEEIRAVWPGYRDEVEAFDAELWTVSQPIVAVAQILGGGVVQCRVDDTENGRVARPGDIHVAICVRRTSRHCDGTRQGDR